MLYYLTTGIRWRRALPIPKGTTITINSFYDHHANSAKTSSKKVLHVDKPCSVETTECEVTCTVSNDNVALAVKTLSAIKAATGGVKRKCP